jgi:hypothetical protein
VRHNEKAGNIFSCLSALLFVIVSAFVFNFLIADFVSPDTAIAANRNFSAIKTGKVKKKATNKTKKKIHQKTAYLTFDDGPSVNTDKVLDILDRYKIKATFFVVGRTDKASIRRYKEIVKRGHNIGLHSLTHNYKLVYASLDSFKKDVYAIRDIVKKYTGVDSKIYRFPGGSSNGVAKINMHIVIKWIRSAGYQYFDWNLGGTDAAYPPPSANAIYNAIAMYAGSNTDKIVLLHDSKDKVNTLRALPRIIELLKREGYRFAKITKNTKPVHHRVNPKYKIK